jgi:tRNA 2-(methylsulfanyl)-N6-isopentenyladenosine37 hydroxylase
MSLTVMDLLRVRTPQAWLDAVVPHRDELLIDHANCEKKAASTALSLMFTYPEDAALSERLSRLAREELRHFEQVQRLMTSLGVAWRRLSPSRYAQRLRQHLRAEEPGRQVDILICGAFIEARSCERFLAMAPALEPPVSTFYQSLAQAEARHFALYLDLARQAAGKSGDDTLDARIAFFAALEAELVTSPDAQFRFHSGPPAL